MSEKKLSEVQEKAVSALKGACVVKAGAGSGKSTVVVEKVKRLVEGGMRPERVLCLTFSNEATSSLKEKIEKKVGLGVVVRTFHGFSSDVLKEFGEEVGVSPGFSVLLPDDAKVMVFKNLGLSAFEANHFVSSVSKARSFSLSLSDYEKFVEKLRSKVIEFYGADESKWVEAYDSFSLSLKTIYLKEEQASKEEKKELREEKKLLREKIKAFDEYKKYFAFVENWRKYDELKQKNNFLDYNDLISKALEVMKKAGDEVGSGFDYVFVDEFQDTNKLQFELIKLLASSHGNITVVGDPNQSIYGFRGAYKENFKRFEEEFNVSKENVFELNESFRCPDNVLKVAHDVIKNNYEKEDDCFEVKNAEGVEGDKVKVFSLVDEREEARKVSELVEEEVKKGIPLKEICILYRTHKQSKLIKKALEAKGIPFVSAGNVNLLQKPEVRTAVAYLSMLNNLIEDNVIGEHAWWSLFHYSHSLSPSDSVKIGSFMKKNARMGKSLTLSVLTESEKIGLSKRGEEVIKDLIRKLGELSRHSNLILPDLVLKVFEVSGLSHAFTSSGRSVESLEAAMNLNEFYETASNFYSLHSRNLNEFIDYLELLNDLGVNIPAYKVKEMDAVKVMTLHAVKGLEFNSVILTNFAEDRFPLGTAKHQPMLPDELLPEYSEFLKSIEGLSEKKREEELKKFKKKELIKEERRLAYVGLTRAKKSLFITRAKEYGATLNDESVFLKEMNYTQNPCIEAVEDDEVKIISPASSKYDLMEEDLKKQLMQSIESDSIKNILSKLVLLLSLKKGEKINLKAIDLNNLVDDEEVEEFLKIKKEHRNKLVFNKQSFTLSPSSIMDYLDCPKKFELKYIFKMPEYAEGAWTPASSGSFIHKVLENGVRQQFNSVEQFKEEVLKLSKEKEYEGVNLEEVNHMIDVFWERNKGAYDENTIVEDWINLELNGFKFNGKVDRIDFPKPGEAVIIDYKSNNKNVPAEKREIQLGFYALGVEKKYNVKSRKLILEMLKLEKPVVGLVDDEGNVKIGNKPFNLNEFREKLEKTAENIMRDYETEYKPTENDSKCTYCKYKQYCPKWRE